MRNDDKLCEKRTKKIGWKRKFCFQLPFQGFFIITFVDPLTIKQRNFWGYQVFFTLHTPHDDFELWNSTLATFNHSNPKSFFKWLAGFLIEGCNLKIKISFRNTLTNFNLKWVQKSWENLHQFSRKQSTFFLWSIQQISTTKKSQAGNFLIYFLSLFSKHPKIMLN